jgi:hypothetical protein
MNKELWLVLGVAFAIGVAGWMLWTQGPASSATGPAVGVFLSAARVVDGIIAPGEYAHSATVADVLVYWANDDEVIHVGLISPGFGYVAIGFDPETVMLGANMILGAVESNGALTIRDDYGTGLIGHAPDVDRGGTSDVLAAAGRESEEGTTVEFTLALDSGDAMDKPLQPGETYRILVSYQLSKDSFRAKHSRRGVGEITLDSGT